MQITHSNKQAQFLTSLFGTKRRVKVARFHNNHEFKGKPASSKTLCRFTSAGISSNIKFIKPTVQTLLTPQSTVGWQLLSLSLSLKILLAPPEQAHIICTASASNTYTIETQHRNNELPSRALIIESPSSDPPPDQGDIGASRIYSATTYKKLINYTSNGRKSKITQQPRITRSLGNMVIGGTFCSMSEEHGREKAMPPKEKSPISPCSKMVKKRGIL